MGRWLAGRAPMILAAFAPDKGELVNTLIADPPPHGLAG
jgi:hypothetical protein